MSGSESEPEYEVEAIVDYRSEDSDGNEVQQYAVKWKGYESSENTWENNDSLTDEMVRKKIRRFKKYRDAISSETRYIEDPHSSVYNERKRKRSRNMLDSDDDDYSMPSDSTRIRDRTNNHNRTHEKLKKKSKKERLREQQEEERRNRRTKGNNAYATGDRAAETQKYRDQMRREEKRKQKMHSSSDQKKLHKRLAMRQPPVRMPTSQKNAEVSALLANNPLGNPIENKALPTARIKSKETKDSYDILAKQFYKKKATTSNETAKADNVLDDF